MNFKNTCTLIDALLDLNHNETILGISDNRLYIWRYMIECGYPHTLVELFERSIGGLYGLKLLVYSALELKKFTDGGYYYFPKDSPEGRYYDELISNYAFEIDLKFTHPHSIGNDGLYYRNIPLLHSENEQMADPDLILQFIDITNAKDFIDEISQHSKYYTFFMMPELLIDGFQQNQAKLFCLISIYRYLKKGAPKDGDMYRHMKSAISCEIQKVQFHFELGKKALGFGFQTFSDIKAAMSTRDSPSLIKYYENIGVEKNEKIIKGRVFKIYHRDDVEKFPSGSIMIAYNTNPEYMKAFLRAKAVIVENTSQLSHAAITCREFNMQGCIGALGSMNFKNNDLVEIDIRNKTIRLCQN